MADPEAHQHEHDHEHGHDHGGLTFERTDVDDATLAQLKDQHPRLAELLDLSRRFPDLEQTDRNVLTETHDGLLEDAPWFPGFHAEGDLCAVCEKPTEALFTDGFHDGGRLAFGAFALGLPLHPACADGLADRFPRPAPRVIDMARRKLMRDLNRPSAEMACWLRRDYLEHDDLDVEAWANHVLEANEDRLTRNLHRDVERCATYVHHQVFHG